MRAEGAYLFTDRGENRSEPNNYMFKVQKIVSFYCQRCIYLIEN